MSNQYLARGASGADILQCARRRSRAARARALRRHGNSAGSAACRRRSGRSTTTRHCLPDNLIRNPDVDTALANDANHPAFLALQRKRHLVVADSAQPQPFNWGRRQQHDRFRRMAQLFTTVTPARIARSSCAGSGNTTCPPATSSALGCDCPTIRSSSLDLTNPLREFDYTVSGTATDFQMFETTISIAGWRAVIRSDFIAGGTASATGSFYIDDISAAMLTPPSLRATTTTTASSTRPTTSFGETVSASPAADLAADGNGDGMVDPTRLRHLEAATSARRAARAVPGSRKFQCARTVVGDRCSFSVASRRQYRWRSRQRLDRVEGVDQT